MTDDLVLTSVEDGLLTITLNRPNKRNAMSLELFKATGEAFDRAAEPDVRVVLLRGEGKDFCAGIDLASLAALGAEGFIATISMNISYLATATSDLTATGVCIKPGRQIQVSEVRVRDASDRLVAEAIVTSTLPS